jgi:hypothetical protein
MRNGWIRRIVVSSIAFGLMAASGVPTRAAVVDTDPSDVPRGHADILRVTKWASVSISGERKLGFRVEFEEPPSQVYSLVRIRIDTGEGPGTSHVVGVDIGGVGIGVNNCVVWLGDGRQRSCTARTTGGLKYTPSSTETWWQVVIRKDWLRPIDRLRWLVSTDGDFGALDVAPDQGWYR